jgi:hypothetical protein
VWIPAAVAVTAIGLVSQAFAPLAVSLITTILGGHPARR